MPMYMYVYEAEWCFDHISMFVNRMSADELDTTDRSNNRPLRSSVVSVCACVSCVCVWMGGHVGACGVGMFRIP